MKSATVSVVATVQPQDAGPRGHEITILRGSRDLTLVPFLEAREQCTSSDVSCTRS